ncbi:anaerobic sulfite reductase subunit AsrA [Clostridium vitabionis]|uniref:anaerobic sulfite reductase subunit AsrA n=1 Tax=Clostridium vitabionis TaxID=2784388 RepID=UPI001889F23C|nr:anaerobic sulfite reductase subunit AsrA [Clostridium vitabionis]
MGYVMNEKGFSEIVRDLSQTFRIYAPVKKTGAGRFTDTDVVMYDWVTEASDIVLDRKSDYSFKEFLTPLSEILFFFTESSAKEAELDERPVLIFLRSCDLHALRRLDEIYLRNGREEDWFYRRRRDKIKLALIGCQHSFENCFCVSMGSNIAKEGYAFSIDRRGDEWYSDVRDSSLKDTFAGHALREEDVEPLHVTENATKVTVPEKIPASIIKDKLWDEYTVRCIGCGRCNFVCPTCTCFSMQDVYYTDNGRVGERRRVAASCMVDGYTNVAGGGQYRRTQGERMRFKVLHKIQDFGKRFGYTMCVGCGRCDDVCPEYISYSNIINKVNEASLEESEGAGKECGE